MESPRVDNTKQSRVVLIVILAVVVLAVAAVIAILLSANSRAPGSSDNTSATSTGLTATITYTDDGFSPSTLTVKKGTVVTVVNSSTKPVQFSSGAHPTHREDPEINLERLSPGEKGTFTATTTGTHSFHDHIDDSKTGTLIVQ